MKIAFLGPSLASAPSNIRASYFRGIVHAMRERGHEVIVCGPYGQNFSELPAGRIPVDDRDHPPRSAECNHDQAKDADLIIEVGNRGSLDSLGETGTAALKRPNNLVVFWDIDAATTVTRVNLDPGDPFVGRVAEFDAVLTTGGGDPIVEAYERLGARHCQPIYPAFDPGVHFPCASEARYTADLGFLGAHLTERQARVNEFFFTAARLCPDGTFLLGGRGWEEESLPPNVKHLGPVDPADRNAFHCTPKCVLAVSQANGFDPPARIFEVAGASACLITDPWEGVERFFEPGVEIIVAEGGEDVAEVVASITPRRARTIGQAAYYRALEEHTYARRVAELEEMLTGSPSPKAVAL